MGIVQKTPMEIEMPFLMVGINNLQRLTAIVHPHMSFCQFGCLCGLVWVKPYRVGCMLYDSLSLDMSGFPVTR